MSTITFFSYKNTNVKSHFTGKKKLNDNHQKITIHMCGMALPFCEYRVAFFMHLYAIQCLWITKKLQLHSVLLKQAANLELALLSVRQHVSIFNISWHFFYLFKFVLVDFLLDCLLKFYPERKEKPYWIG